MSLSLNAIARNPYMYRISIPASDGVLCMLRPLVHEDEKKLISLIEGLSEETKAFYSYTQEPRKIAKELCDAINRYDKLRFVLENEQTKELIGMFELSMDIPSGDKHRFNSYSITLTDSTCRFAPILTDSYHSKGLATQILPYIIFIARKFGKQRMILWGGVHQHNTKAIHFYEKHQFKNVGSFTSPDGKPCFDMMRNLY